MCRRLPYVLGGSVRLCVGWFPGARQVGAEAVDSWWVEPFGWSVWEVEPGLIGAAIIGEGRVWKLRGSGTV